MPTIIKTNIAATVAGLPVLPLTPPPTDIPELWAGLQFFLDANWIGAFANVQSPADDPIVAWQNKWSYRWEDAAARLSWRPGGTGSLYYQRAHRFAASGNGGWPLMSSDAARLVNGRKVLTSAIYGQYLHICGDPTDGSAQTALLTNDYTWLIVYKAEAGCTGGLFGQFGLRSNTDAASGGLRFGYESGTNTGKTLFQHRGGVADTDRLLIARDTANNLPTFAIISAAANNAGSVRLKNNGSQTDHAFTFTNPVTNKGGDTISIGYQDSAGVKRRDITMVARWSRQLSADDLAYLSAWLETNYGPF